MKKCWASGSPGGGNTEILLKAFLEGPPPGRQWRRFTCGVKISRVWKYTIVLKDGTCPSRTTCRALRQAVGRDVVALARRSSFIKSRPAKAMIDRTQASGPGATS